MQEQQATMQAPTVPKSIVRRAKHMNSENNGTLQPWPASPVVQQQQQQQQQIT
jgi:hypothetical protein